VIAPAGADEGPARSPLLPQTAAGADTGAGPDGLGVGVPAGGGVGVAVPVVGGVGVPVGVALGVGEAPAVGAPVGAPPGAGETLTVGVPDPLGGVGRGAGHLLCRG